MPPSGRPEEVAGLGRGYEFDPTWCLRRAESPSGAAERVTESLLCLSDGVVGTRAVLEEREDPEIAAVMAGGVYEAAEQVTERLLELASWFALPLRGTVPGERVLDLRDGTLTRRAGEGADRLVTVRFASARRPGLEVLVAEGPEAAFGADPPTPTSLRRYCGAAGGVAVATESRTVVEARSPARARLERLSVHVSSSRRLPPPSAAARRLSVARAAGLGRLAEEQRATWRRRWAVADLEAVGDEEITLAARLSVFHLLSSGRRHGETAIGARGLTGPAYAGHVFWDTDVFVLPVLAALDPPAARAALEYRLRRLGTARRRAGREGRAGARFPWESARTGEEVTPSFGVDYEGRRVAIRTGELEEHVTADVAWAAWRYAALTGDVAFLQGPGRPLVVETARYFASRVTTDQRGRAHLLGVIGPDEYHEGVDDNAFTNLMARWNLRRGAELLAGDPGGEAREEAAGFLSLADALVDNLEQASGRYEQFTGYDELKPHVAADFGRPPYPADLILGLEGTAATQLIKQADVLMAHYLVPDEVAPGSLAANLEHYLPRCVHGSSLSPGVHAALLARAGRADEALELLRVAVAVDLEDLTGTTAEGLHLANLGAIWQALVHGFAGLELPGPGGELLRLAPQLPSSWQALRLGLRWRGRPLRLVLGHDGVEVAVDRPVELSVFGQPWHVEPPGGRM